MTLISHSAYNDIDRDYTESNDSKYSKYTSMTDAELCLIARSEKEGSAPVRNYIIAKYRKLIAKKVYEIGRVYEYCGYAIDDDALYQSGRIAILDAINDYDAEKASFATYAGKLVEFEIKKELRKANSTIHIPENVHRDIVAIKQYHADHPQLSRSEITEELINANMISSKEDFERAELFDSVFDLQSLESLVKYNDEDSHGYKDILAIDPEKETLSKEVQQRVSKILNELPDTERKIAEMIYGLNGKGSYSVAEISERLGVSRAAIHRADQLLRDMIKKSDIKELAE